VTLVLLAALTGFVLGAIAAYVLAAVSGAKPSYLPRHSK
jgi:hypothetical protein